ncbi:hypothetical protein GCM10009639_18150 [Kitasatospora putterlickiae]|uniref:Uncharacterized protein n=1 Tax=Kitasatospora putterlickiae TaxID=221725 RepID=A0ABN1XUC2_9ACTN
MGTHVLEDAGAALALRRGESKVHSDFVPCRQELVRCSRNGNRSVATGVVPAASPAGDRSKSAGGQPRTAAFALPAALAGTTLIRPPEGCHPLETDPDSGAAAAPRRPV